MKAEFIGVGENWSFENFPYENLQAFEQELSLLGIETEKKSMVASDSRALFSALRDAIQRSDVIFLVGGLGHGGNQIAHKVLCAGLSIRMQQNAFALQNAKDYFADRNLPTPGYLQRYSKLPVGSIPLPNPNGPFSGAVLARKTQCIFSLPEHPDEFFPMLLGSVLPYLAEFQEKELCTQSFVVWDSSPTELAEALQIPADADYVVAAYRIGRDPARHLVRVSIRRDLPDGESPSVDTILQTLEGRLEGFATENADQPIMQTIVALSLQKNLKIAVAEYNTEHALADAIRALPNAENLYTYDLSECRPEVRKKVFGLPEHLLNGIEVRAAEVSAYMARSVREIDDVTLGLAACRQSDHGCSLTATDGRMMLFFADVVPAELPTAAALLLYRFIKAHPAQPREAILLETVVGKNVSNPRMEKAKELWKKIKEG